ncbi:hypothetical protein LQE21_001162, partial [Proteus mirabilis]|nr:hypothetical protein [Proteus mirabilis]
MESVDTMQTIFEVISFIASIASLILAIGAIWLSIVFFKMSEHASKETSKSADKIQSSVDKLEKLFDKLYSDTFSMMKDTVGDMRQHIYHSPEKNNLSFEDKLNSMKDNITKDFKTLLEERFKDLHENGNKIKALELEVEKILEKQITTAISDDEKNEEIIKSRIMEILKDYYKISAKRIINIMMSKYGYTEEDHLHQYLFSLREEN